MRGVIKGLGGAALPPRAGRPSITDGAGAGAGAMPGAPATLPRAHSSSTLAEQGSGSAGQVAACAGGVDAVVTPSGEPPQPTLSDHSAAAQQHQTTQQQQQQQQQPQQGGHAEQQGQASPDGSAPGSLQRQQAAPQPPSQGGHPREGSRLGLEGACSSRSRRQRSATPSSAGAAAPPSKRRRGAAGGGAGGTSPAGGHRPSKYADIMHRFVEVPGAIFFIDTPGEVFIGRVNKAESGRRVPSVEVQFLDDSQKYWFPVADVRRWMADMVRSGSWARRNPGIPAPDFAAGAAAADAAGAAAAAGRPPAPSGEDEAAAAKTLQSLSVSATSRPAASGAGGGGAQPAVSTGRQQRRASDARTASTAAGGGPGLQRSGSEVKRVGALDIMATAADLRCANSPPAS